MTSGSRKQTRRNRRNWNLANRRPLRGAFLIPPPEGAVADFGIPPHRRDPAPRRVAPRLPLHQCGSNRDSRLTGRLYLASEEGRVFVVKMGPEFALLATNTLEDQIFIATPAIVDGEVFLRSQAALYCISPSSQRMLVAPLDLQRIES